MVLSPGWLLLFLIIGGVKEMNNWITLRCFAKPDKLWFVRVTSILKAVGELSLDMRNCEVGIVPDMIQEVLNRTHEQRKFMHEL